MKTIIISAFPGCGKTYLSVNQEQVKYSILDAESSTFSYLPVWEKKYIDFIEKLIGHYDFILISQHDNVLLELYKRSITFFTVAPDNSNKLSDRERLLIKQQWFGRLVLRDNSHIKNFNAWILRLKLNYDNWTDSVKLLDQGSKKHFSLKANQYLSDIIEEIYNQNVFPS